MPLIDSVHYEPDEAVAKGHCPECGKPLAGVNIDDEIARHWPALPEVKLKNPEAARRAEMLYSYAAKSVVDLTPAAEVK